MLTRKRWTPPIIPSGLDEDVRRYLQEQNKSISDYLLSLEAKGSLSIDEAYIRAAQGIAFPATQVASSDVNVLDDYEEGTWTPSDGSGASLSITTTYATYTKIGGVVVLRAQITYPATASGANASLNGVPFSCTNQGWASINTDSANARGVVISGTNLAFGTGVGTAVTNAQMSGKFAVITAVYEV